MKKFFNQVCDLIGVELTSVQLDLFALYEQDLLIWNERINLTAIREPESIRTKHFLDSLTCAFAWQGSPPPQNLIDIGTGAGFPGIPLKILLPDLQLTLVESVGKKADYCRHLVETLHLQDVDVINARAEEVGVHPAHREKYDVAVARAVARMNILAEYLLPLVHPGGLTIAQKGNTALAEGRQSNRAVTILGGTIRPLITVTLPGLSEPRYLVILDKIKPTPPNYPRRVGVPARKPL
mgnify:CR=1 FL=1